MMAGVEEKFSFSWNKEEVEDREKQEKKSAVNIRLEISQFCI